MTFSKSKSTLFLALISSLCLTLIFSMTAYAQTEEAHAVYEEGVSLFLANNSTEALEVFNRAIELAPDFADAYAFRGASYLNLGNPQAASDDFDEAMSLDPDSAIVKSFYARFLQSGGEREAALEEANNAVELASEDWLVYFNRAMVYWAQQQNDAVLTDLTRAIELNPDEYLPYYWRGSLYYRQGEYELTAEDMASALAARPNDVPAMAVQALMFAYTGRCQSVKDAFENIYSINEDESLEQTLLRRHIDANEACVAGIEPKYQPGGWYLSSSAPIADCRGSSFSFPNTVIQLNGSLVGAVGFASTLRSGPEMLSDGSYRFTLFSSTTPDNGVTFNRMADVTLAINSPTSISSTYVVTWDISQGTNCEAQTVNVSLEYIAENTNSICLITASQSVNLRSGPGTNFEQAGQLANQEIPAIGQSTASDGIWWQLPGNRWVRSDVVQVGDNCDSVPEVE